MPRSNQTSFASGEITPALHARVDLARYLSALKTLRNMQVRPQGGARNRAGTRHVTGTKGTSRVRLLPFNFNADQTYVLEFGEGYVRWITNGFRLAVPGTDAAIVNGDFESGITGWSDQSTGGASIAATGGLKLVSTTQGTPIGNMTGNAGLAAAFDGFELKDSPDCARVLGPTDGRIGKDWGVGTPKKLGRFRLVGSADRGFKSGGGSPPISVELQGSADTFQNDVVSLGEWFLNDRRGEPLDVTSDFDDTAYRSHRVRIRGGGDDAETYVAELELYEPSATSGRLSLIGAVGGVAVARQTVTLTTTDQSHVLRFRVIGSGTARTVVRIGSSPGGRQLVDDAVYARGVHALEFIPGNSAFTIEFRNVQADTVGIDDVSLLGSGSLVPVTLELKTPYDESQLRDIGYTQSADVMTLVHRQQEIKELRRLGALSWSIIDKGFRPTVAAPGAADVVITKSAAGTGSTYKYRVTFENEDGLESEAGPVESVVNDVALSRTNNNIFVITLPAEVERANVYKLRGGEYGYIGSTRDGDFVDDGLLAQLDDQPPEPREPFDRPGQYPGAVAYFEQRLVLAGTRKAPDTFEMSQPGAYGDFARSDPSKDSDSITGTLSSREVNRIRHMVDLGSLLLFTTGAVWRLGRGERGLTPALEGGVRKDFAFGCDPPPPLEIGSSVLFVQAGGRTVRDLTYDDGIEAVTGAELSLLSAHLLDDFAIVEWTWAAEPDQTAWMVRDDGTMLTLAYLREQEVVGWGRQDTKGFFESVVSVREEGVDQVYVAVRRLVRGFYRRDIEVFTYRDFMDQRDGIFLDASKTVDRPRTIIEVRLIFPLQVKAEGHGCVVGDLIDIDEVDELEVRGDDGTVPDTLAARLNGKRFKVMGVGGNVLTLGTRYAEATEDDPGTIDATGWPPWIGGGVVRKCVSTVTDMVWLEGETVVVLADGNVHPPLVVVDGAVTLEYPASRIHVGLPYVSDLETLSLALEPNDYGKRKVVKAVQVYLRRTRGLMIGPARQLDRPLALEEWKQRELEDLDDPTSPFSGLADVTVQSVYADGGALRIRQADPLPIEVLSIVPHFEVGG